MSKKFRCLVCRQKLVKGQAKVLRTGDVRNGPFCMRCYKDLIAELESQGVEVVPGGDVPPGSWLNNPALGGGFVEVDNLVAHAKEKNVKIAYLWDFPECDFPLWHDLLCQENDGITFGPINNTYAEYQGFMSRLRKDLEAQGIQCVFVKATVKEMIAACKEIGVEFNPQGRSIAIHHLGNKQTGLDQHYHTV